MGEENFEDELGARFREEAGADLAAGRKQDVAARRAAQLKFTSEALQAQAERRVALRAKMGLSADVPKKSLGIDLSRVRAKEIDKPLPRLQRALLKYFDHQGKIELRFGDKEGKLLVAKFVLLGKPITLEGTIEEIEEQISKLKISL